MQYVTDKLFHYVKNYMFQIWLIILRCVNIQLSVKSQHRN
jgi:hypothetical protein